MAWRIHEFDSCLGCGSVESPHFGPIRFAPAANVDGVNDFRSGETVVVDLDGKPQDFAVKTIRPTHQRQPKRTEWPEAQAILRRFGDLRVDEDEPEHIQFWLGDCCELCTPEPIHLRFEEITTRPDLGDDCDLGSPLFRYASQDELEEARVRVPPGARGYQLVTNHGAGRDGPSYLIVAGKVSIFSKAGGAV